MNRPLKMPTMCVSCCWKKSPCCIVYDGLRGWHEPLQSVCQQEPFFSPAQEHLMEASSPGEKGSVGPGGQEKTSRQTSASFMLFLASKSDHLVHVSRGVNFSHLLFQQLIPGKGLAVPQGLCAQMRHWSHFVFHRITMSITRAVSGQ